MLQGHVNNYTTFGMSRVFSPVHFKHHSVIFKGIVMGFDSHGDCLRFCRHPSLSIMLFSIHIAFLASWKDEVLPQILNVDMSSDLGRISAIKDLTSSGEFFAGMGHPVFFPGLFLCA